MMEQRLNAVVALKHILTLIPPLRSTLSKARSPLISSFVQVLSERYCLSRLLYQGYGETSEIELFGSAERSNNITGRRQSFLVLDPFLHLVPLLFCPHFEKNSLLFLPFMSFYWFFLVSLLNEPCWSCYMAITLVCFSFLFLYPSGAESDRLRRTIIRDPNSSRRPCQSSQR